MKKLLFLFFLGIIACTQKTSKTQVVEVSCGQCKFGLDSQKGCDLAVRINDTAYFVDGAHIDEFGDAHDINMGFCNVIRKAEVTGEIIENRFVASKLKLID